MSRLTTVTAGEESCLVQAHAHFRAQIAEVSNSAGEQREAGEENRDLQVELAELLREANMPVEQFLDVSGGLL